MNRESGNLRKAKLRLMNDPELKKLLVRSGWNEIVLDLDGDGSADVCFSDESGDGDIDTVAIDLTGDGEFNLYLHDADGNGIPDTVFWAEDGSEELELIAFGSGVEQELIRIGGHIRNLLIAEEFLNEEFNISLADLTEYLKNNLAQLIEEVNRIANAEGIDKVYYFLEGAETYYLATVEAMSDDYLDTPEKVRLQPRVRPFGTILLYDGRLYIQTGKVKEVSKQIAENPYVELCAYMDGTWLRIAGELVNDDSVDIKRAMLEKMPSLKAMYSAEDSNMQMLYFKNATATFSSFTAEPEVIQF